MKSFVVDIEQAALSNSYFRQVLFTASNCQLVVMSLPPGEDIGEEIHTLDQFIRVEEGTGEVVLNGESQAIGPGTAMVITAGTKHNVRNSSDSAMKLYTVYAPPNHKDGTIHKTKADAEADHEHFDGITS